MPGTEDTTINCLFPRDPKQLRWGQPLWRHRFLLLQNRHTAHPVHKLRAWDAGLLALIAMDGMYAGFAGAKGCHEKIRINRSALDIEASHFFERKTNVE